MSFWDVIVRNSRSDVLGYNPDTPSAQVRSGVPSAHDSGLRAGPGAFTGGTDVITGNALNGAPGRPSMGGWESIIGNATRGAPPPPAPQGPPPMPVPPQVGGGPGGAGGGFNASAGMHMIPSFQPTPVNAGFDMTTGLDAIQKAQQSAALAAGQLDAMFNERKKILSDLYKTEETPQEKANIQHLLNIIEVQRKQGTKVIERVYGAAVKDAAARAEATRGAGTRAAGRTQETFSKAATDSAELLQSLKQTFGGAMGAGGEPLSPAAEAGVSDLHRMGAAEAAFDQRMFDLNAADIDFLGEAMRPEMGAQVGALQRRAAETSAGAQFQHNREVQQRITAERMAHAQALQQLAQQIDARRWGLEDQQIGLGVQHGQQEASNQALAAQLRMQAAQIEQSDAQFAASLRMQAAQLEASNQQHAASLRQAGPSWTQQQEWDLQMLSWEQQMAQHQQSQFALALAGLGVPSRRANFASQLGLGPGLGSEILKQQYATSDDPRAEFLAGLAELLGLGEQQ